MGVDSTTIGSMSFVNNASTPTIPQQSRPSVGAIEEIELVDPKNTEAQKLISFVIVHFPTIELVVHHALVLDITWRITSEIAHIAFLLHFAQHLFRGMVVSFIRMT